MIDQVFCCWGFCCYYGLHCMLWVCFPFFTLFISFSVLPRLFQDFTFASDPRKFSDSTKSALGRTKLSDLCFIGFSLNLNFWLKKQRKKRKRKRKKRMKKNKKDADTTIHSWHPQTLLLLHQCLSSSSPSFAFSSSPSSSSLLSPDFNLFKSASSREKEQRKRMNDNEMKKRKRIEPTTTNDETDLFQEPMLIQNKGNKKERGIYKFGEPFGTDDRDADDCLVRAAAVGVSHRVESEKQSFHSISIRFEPSHRKRKSNWERNTQWWISTPKKNGVDEETGRTTWKETIGKDENGRRRKLCNDSMGWTN